LQVVNKEIEMKPMPLVRTIVILAAVCFAIFCSAFIERAHAANTPSPLIISFTSESQQSTLTAPRPTYTDAIVLTASSSQTQAIPAGSNYVIFSAACNFFAKAGASASVPGSTTTDGSAAQQNPAGWWLNQGDTQITIISAQACIVTLSFYM
jgi:hypothetical protein